MKYILTALAAWVSRDVFGAAKKAYVSSKENAYADDAIRQALVRELQFRNTEFRLVGATVPSLDEILDPNWMSKPRTNGTALNKILKEV